MADEEHDSAEGPDFEIYEAEPEILSYITVREQEVSVANHPMPGLVISNVEHLEMRERTPFEDLVDSVVEKLYEESPEHVEETEEERRLVEKYGAYGGNGWGTPPDPWLITLAYVIWEGIVQGFAYDAVKHIALRAMDRLRSFGIGPTNSGRHYRFRLEFESRKYRKETAEGTVEDMYRHLKVAADAIPTRARQALTEELPVDGRLSKDPRYQSHGIADDQGIAGTEPADHFAEEEQGGP